MVGVGTGTAWGPGNRALAARPLPPGAGVLFVGCCFLVCLLFIIVLFFLVGQGEKNHEDRYSNLCGTDGWFRWF